MELKKHICTLPFTHLTIHDKKEQYFCCKQWLDVPLSFDNGWDSEDAKKVRKSMIDGTFEFCSTNNCPHLSTLVNLNYLVKNGPIILKDKLPNNFNFKPKGPKSIRFTFDSACNLACPSCRKDFIKNSDEITKTSDNIINQIYEKYGDTLEEVSLSGYGDPFYSTSMINFLQNINESKLPNLKHIHLHTNAILWNPKNWEKIKNSHRFISSAEISIDAATKETYEKVRRGGNWDLLIENIKFINEIDSVKNIIVSFVMQKDNYHEIYSFYELMNSLFTQKNIQFLYHSIQDWGIMEKEKYEELKVWDLNHDEYDNYVKEIIKLKSIKDNRVAISNG